MTEEQWSSCTNLPAMLGFLWDRGDVSERGRLGLFACACCLGGDGGTDRTMQAAARVAERYADDRATLAQLAAAQEYVSSIDDLVSQPQYGLVCCVTSRNADDASLFIGDALLYLATLEGVETAYLLRDVFGSLPFRPLPAVARPVLEWDEGLVPRLAEAAYEKRSAADGTLDRDRLLVLADALEEAGCGEEELLTHLRGPGKHIRGCHVVDLLLAKK